MKQNHTEAGRLSDKGHGLGTVTREMVRRRAQEIALINGRGKNPLIEADLEQARRELTGEEGLVPEPTPAERLPETERWDPVAGSSGNKTPPVPAPDEQTFAEELVEEGVEDAEHDQMLDASRESLKRDAEE